MFKNKRNRVLVSTAFAVALTSSAIVPAVTVSAAYDITDVVVEQNGDLYVISKQLFNAAISLNLVKSSDIKYIQLDNKYYSKSFFNSVLGLGYSIEDAFEYLATSNRDEDITPVEGKIEKGKLVPTTPSKEPGKFEVTEIK